MIKRGKHRPVKYNSADKVEKLLGVYFKKCDTDDIPYTVSGIALALDLSNREALQRYEKGKNKSLPDIVKQQLMDVIKKAKLKVENQQEIKMLKSNSSMALAWLKCNAKWIEEDKKLGLKINIKQDIRYQIESVPKLKNPVLIDGIVREAISIDKPKDDA